MRIVSFKSIRDRALRRRGLNPDEGVQVSTFLAVGEYISQHVRDTWEWMDWPELCVWQERALRTVWNTGTQYAIGQEVYYSTLRKYYRALAISTNVVPTTILSWEEIAPDAYLDFTTAGADTIGSVLDVRTADPRKIKSPPRLDFVNQGDRVYFFASGITTLWVRFRQPPSQFSGLDWITTTTYAAGDCVYVPTKGECYVATTPNSGVNPPADSAIWVMQEMPLVLASSVVYRTTADLFREDEQFDKADELDGKALETLMAEADKFLIQTTETQL